MEITVRLSEQEIAAAIDRAVEVNQRVRSDLSVETHLTQSHTHRERNYRVTRVNGTAVSCTCPAYHFGQLRCKHMRAFD